MISELLLGFASNLITFTLGLLPTAGPPGWMVDGGAELDTALAYGAGLGAWIPWSLIGTVLAAIFASLLIGFGIKLVRVVASFFLGGGGGAA